MFVGCILVPRAHDPSGLWQGSRALTGPDFLSMRRAFVSYSRPIKFVGKSVNRGLPVLDQAVDQARALEPCHRPEGSWALGTRMCWLNFLVFRKLLHAAGNRRNSLPHRLCYPANFNHSHQITQSEKMFIIATRWNGIGNCIF